MSEAGSRAADTKARFGVACAHRSRRCRGEICVSTGHGNPLSRALVAAVLVAQVLVDGRSSALSTCGLMSAPGRPLATCRRVHLPRQEPRAR